MPFSKQTSIAGEDHPPRPAAGVGARFCPLTKRHRIITHQLGQFIKTGNE